MENEFKGCFTALITPFSGGSVDEEAFANLVAFNIKGGVHGLVPCGTTGESPTLSHDEHNRVVELCVRASGGAVPVVAGTGSNSTAEAISLTQHAEKVGADAALVVTPYYNLPNQRGIYLHFKAVAGSVGIPVILYNIGSRTGRNIETDTVARLAADCPNIIGVKEASGSLEQMEAVKQACGDDFIILSGDDALTVPIMERGGHGVVSVASNIAPGDVSSLVNAQAAGDKAAVDAGLKKLEELFKVLFIDTNPIPVKEAAAMLGLCEPDLRLPLCSMVPEDREKLRAVLESTGLTH